MSSKAGSDPAASTALVAPSDQFDAVDTTLTALLYLRVSTKEQAEMGGEAEGFSIPAQREACGRKAEQLGAVVVDEFVDRGESARSAKRPELQALLRYIAENRVNYLIVHKVDRLARNRVDDVEINLVLQAHGVTLVSVTENIDETPSGLLLHGIMSSIAEFYSRNLANEVIKGSVQKAKSGGTVGKAPTGYRNIRQIENGREVRTVEIDPERGPLMAWAFEQYATGDWRMRPLLEALIEKGLTSSGGPRTPSKPLSLSNFARLLRTPYYMGVVSYRGVQYPGNHEPLVSAETYLLVQDVLDAHGRAGEKQRLHHHYLKGSVFCGQCNSRLSVMRAKNRFGTVYPYFFCLGRASKRLACQQRVVLIDRVEDAVAKYYASVSLTIEQRLAVRQFVVDQLNQHQQEAAAEQERQQRRVQQLQDERQKLLQAHYAGAIPLELLKSEQNRISRELEGAERLLVANQAQGEVVVRLDAALALSENCQEAYRRATPQVRRWMNQVFFERLEITDEYEVQGELTPPFQLLLDGELRQAAVAEEQRRAKARASGTTYCRERAVGWTGGQKNNTPAFAGVGSSIAWMVGRPKRGRW